MSRLTENDKAIQHLLEQGLNPDSKTSNLDSAEANAYKTVFEALDTKPAEGLPFTFASKVILEIRTRENLRFVFHRQILVAALLIIIFMAFCFVISFVDESITIKIFHLAIMYKWILGFGIFTYLAVEYWNYRMIRK